MDYSAVASPVQPFAHHPYHQQHQPPYHPQSPFGSHPHSHTQPQPGPPGQQQRQQQHQAPQQPFPYHQQQQQQQQQQQHPQHQQQGLEQHQVPPSPSPYPPDQLHRFPGPQQSSPETQWNGAVGNAYSGATSSISPSAGIAIAGSGMMPPNMMQQQQQQQQRMQAGGPPNPYMAASQQAPGMYPVTPQRTPMAGMPMGNTSNQPTNMPPLQTSQPQGQTSQQNTPQSATTPATILSPEELSRQQNRVTALIDINNEILQKLVQLQKEGKAGPEGQNVPSRPEDLKAANGKAVPSQEYIDCLRCLQSNLAYLAQSNPGKVAIIPKGGPAIMDAPSSVPTLTEYYAKLKPLFPGWNGGAVRPSPPQGNSALPRQGATNSGTT